MRKNKENKIKVLQKEKNNLISENFIEHPRDKIIFEKYSSSNFKQYSLFQILNLDLFLTNEEIAEDDEEVEQYISLLMINLKNLLDLKVYFGYLSNIVNSTVLNVVHSQMSQLQKLESLQIFYDKNQNVEFQNISVLAESLKKLNLIKIFKFSTSRIQQLMKSIGNLQNLEELTLKFNQKISFDNKCFTILSNSLKKLTKTTKFSLKVEENNIRALGAEGIASCLKNMKSLKILKLKIKEGNYIIQDGYNSIGFGLASLKQLEHLKIDIEENEKVDTQFLEKLMKRIDSIRNLKSLSLRLKAEQRIEAKSIKQFQTTLKNLSNLSVLKINLENFIIEGEKNIIAFENIFKNVHPLIELEYYLSPSNEVSQTFAGYFFLSLENLRNIEKLCLSLQTGTQLTTEDVQSIQNSLNSNNNIQKLHLHISDNCILDEMIFTQLCKQFSLLQNVNQFYLEIGKKNFINSDYMNSISTNLEQLNYLTHLYLYFQEDNLIDQSNLLSLSNLFQVRQNLIVLDLQFGENNVISSGVEQLSKHLNCLTQLQSFGLKIENNNIINGEEFNHLFQQIGNLINLQNLSIMIDQSISTQITKTKQIFKKLTKITSLSIKMNINNITDEDSFIFKGIEFLSNLQQVNFNIQSDNSLTVLLQVGLVAEISNLKQLSQIEFHIQGKCLLTNQLQENKYSFLKIQANNYFFYFQQDEINSNDLAWPLDTFKKLHSILYFNLDLKKQKSIDQNELEYFFIQLKYFTKLKYFKLDFENQESQENDLLQFISESLFHFTELQSLSINYKSQFKCSNTKYETCLYLAMQNLTNLSNINLHIFFDQNFNISLQIKLIMLFSDLQQMKQICIYFTGTNQIISFEKQMLKGIKKDNNFIEKAYQQQNNVDNQAQLNINNKEDDFYLNLQQILKQIYQTQNQQNFNTQFEIKINEQCQIDKENLNLLYQLISTTILNKIEIILLKKCFLKMDDFISLGHSLKQQKNLTNLKLEIDDHQSLNRESMITILDDINQIKTNLKQLVIKINNRYQSIYDMLLFIGFLLSMKQKVQEVYYKFKVDKFNIDIDNQLNKDFQIFQLGNNLYRFQIFKNPELETQKVQMIDEDESIHQQIDEKGLEFNALTVLNQLDYLMVDCMPQNNIFGINQIALGLLNINQLKHLNIQFSESLICNQLSSEFLGQSISQMQGLTNLKINFHNEFDQQDSDSFSFAESISQLPNLQHLILYFKYICTPMNQARFLEMVQPKNKKLLTLDIQMKGYYDIQYSNLKNNISYVKSLIIQNDEGIIIQISQDQKNQIIQSNEPLKKILQTMRRVNLISYHFSSDNIQNQQKLIILKDIIDVIESEMMDFPNIFINFNHYIRLNEVIDLLSKSFKILRNTEYINITISSVDVFEISIFKQILSNVSQLSKVKYFVLKNQRYYQFLQKFRNKIIQQKNYLYKRMKRLVRLTFDN